MGLIEKTIERLEAEAHLGKELSRSVRKSKGEREELERIAFGFRVVSAGLSSSMSNRMLRHVSRQVAERVRRGYDRKELERMFIELADSRGLEEAEARQLLREVRRLDAVSGVRLLARVFGSQDEVLSRPELIGQINTSAGADKRAMSAHAAGWMIADAVYENTPLADVDDLLRRIESTGVSQARFAYRVAKDAARVIYSLIEKRTALAAAEAARASLMRGRGVIRSLKSHTAFYQQEMDTSRPLGWTMRFGKIAYGAMLAPTSRQSAAAFASGALKGLTFVKPVALAASVASAVDSLGQYARASVD